MTDEERCQRYVRLLNKYTDLHWSFGYVGNLYGDGTDDRVWCAFAAHPNRVGTYRDRIGECSKPAELIPMLQGAVELAIVQSHRKAEANCYAPSR